MMAVRTTLKAADLPDSLAALRRAIERAVPHGRAPGRRDPGAWGERAPHHVDEVWKTLAPGFDQIRQKYPKLEDQQLRPPGYARYRQSFHRGLPGRSRQCLVHVA